MQLVILAGGRATRLRILCGETPKSLVPILSKPFLERALPIYSKLGFLSVIIAIRYRDPVKAEYEKIMTSCWGSSYKIIEDQTADAGTGGCLMGLLPHLNMRFAVVNGDSWFSVEELLGTSLKNFILCQKGSCIVIAQPHNYDIPNIAYHDSSNAVVAYNKTAVFSDEIKRLPGIKYGIDYGIFITEKIDIADYSMKSKKDKFDIGKLYEWLIFNGKLQNILTNGDYIDVGTYRGWSRLSSELAKIDK